MFKKYSLLLLSCCLLCACSDKQTNKQTVDTKVDEVEQDQVNTTDKKIILCFGNSLTAGYGLDEDQAWPSLMQNRIDSLALNYTVVNAGLSGETTSGGLNRIDWILNQQVDVFILELGANDMLRGLAIDETEKNLKEILKRVKKKNPKIEIIVAGMLSPKNMGAEYENRFNGIFPWLAEEFEGALIPFLLEGVAMNEELNLPDGRHPNEAGQKIVLNTVWKALNPLIK